MSIPQIKQEGNTKQEHHLFLQCDQNTIKLFLYSSIWHHSYSSLKLVCFVFVKLFKKLWRSVGSHCVP